MANQQNFTSQQGSSPGGGAKPEGTSQGGVSRSHETAEHLKSAAVEQAEQIKTKAASVKEHTVDRVRRVGSMLRSAGEGIRSDDDFVATYADRAAQKIDQIADYLGSSEPRVLARDAERVARENPAWFFGGAFVLGLATARFLKASGSTAMEGAGSDWSGSRGNSSFRDQSSSRRYSGSTTTTSGGSMGTSGGSMGTSGGSMGTSGGSMGTSGGSMGTSGGMGSVAGTVGTARPRSTQGRNPMDRDPGTDENNREAPR
jgi:hypothetical protein